MIRRSFTARSASRRGLRASRVLQKSGHRGSLANDSLHKVHPSLSRLDLGEIKTDMQGRGNRRECWPSGRRIIAAVITKFVDGKPQKWCSLSSCMCVPGVL
jgi:hypothetical protein